MTETHSGGQAVPPSWGRRVARAARVAAAIEHRQAPGFHPVASAAIEADPATTGFRLVRGTGTLGRPQIKSGAPVSGAEPVLRVSLHPPNPDAEVEFYGQVDLEIVFGERRIRQEIIQKLYGVGVFVLSRFDEDFGEDLAPEVRSTAGHNTT